MYSSTVEHLVIWMLKCYMLYVAHFSSRLLYVVFLCVVSEVQNRVSNWTAMSYIIMMISFSGTFLHGARFTNDANYIDEYELILILPVCAHCLLNSADATKTWAIKISNTSAEKWISCYAVVGRSPCLSLLSLSHIGTMLMNIRMLLSTSAHYKIELILIISITLHLDYVLWCKWPLSLL